MVANMDDPIPVIIDSREPADFIHVMKSALNTKNVKTKQPLFDVIIQALPVGDFVLNNTIGIERKTADDFLSSIPNRIFRQIEELETRFGRENSYLLLEGSILKALQWNHHVKKERAFGVLRWCGQHCCIINSFNKTESCEYVKNLTLQTVKEDTPKLPEMVVTKPRQNETNPLRFAQAVLQTFPYIGVSISGNILKEHKNILNFFNDIALGKIPSFKFNNKEETCALWKDILTTEYTVGDKK